MLIDDLNRIINVLDRFIENTKQDLSDIKEAKHNEVFERNELKASLLAEFSELKSRIDQELLRRAQVNQNDLTNMLNISENDKLDIFKEKLAQFNKLHKEFSKLLLSITNFYTQLYNQVTESEVDIGYQNRPKRTSYFDLKG